MFEGMSSVRKAASSRRKGWSVYRHTFCCIIAIHRNKERLKHLKTKKEGQLEVKYVDNSDEEREKDDVPLKCKRQGEEEALG